MTGIPAKDLSADRPNIARVYDYLLGGSHNFAPDRIFAQELLAQWPEARDTMRVNRAFLSRAVRYLAQQAGIRQFLDIGSGIPTMGNVHEIAQQTAPGTHVVYVDFDPADLLEAQRSILLDPADPTVLAAARESGIADGYLRHVTGAMETYSQATAPFQLRSHAEILRFFHGFNLLAPGLVRIPLWRPDDPPEADAPANQIAGYAGVGLKP